VIRARRRPYTARVRQLWIVCAALLLGALLTPAAHAQAPLTPAQFAAIDGIYTTQIPLSKDKPSTRSFADARAACRALDSADPLLGPLRKACTASVNLVRPINEFTACRTALGCLRSARRARIALTEHIGRLRAMNVAVDAAMLVDGCRNELRASRTDLRYLERTRALLRLLQEALVTGSPKLARRVEREGKALDRRAAKQPTATRERINFRAACTPPAT